MVGVPLLDVNDVSCTRGDRRLFSGLTFALRGGQVLHLSGPNGSGKTTLLRILCGLTLPEAGEVRWRGESIADLKEEYARELLYLGHLNGLKAELTPVENLAAWAALRGEALDERRILSALASMGLRFIDDLPVKVLSQGQKRRVALARLLLCSQPLWILDEPFVALDVKAVRVLEKAIETHVVEGGMVVLTTHQPFSLARGELLELALGR